MPGWLISMLISAALKFGVPYVLDWLHKKFPWLPVNDETKKIIGDLADSMRQTRGMQRAAKRVAAQKLRACHGMGCAPTLVE